MQRNRVLAQFAAPVGRHRFHDVADKRAVLHAARGEARRFVADPDHQVGGLLDLFHFVAIDDLLVAGEIDDARTLLRAASGRWRRAPHCRVRRRPAAPFPPPAFRSACRSDPSESPARPASAARTDRTIRPSRERWSKAVPFRDRPKRRSAPGLPCRAPCLWCAAPAIRNSAGDRTGPAGTRARRWARARSLPRCSASGGPRRAPPARSSSSSCRSSAAGAGCDGCPLRRACAKPPDSPASRCPSP